PPARPCHPRGDLAAQRRDRRRRPDPAGKLKITAPPAVGNEVIAPLAVDFVEAYPEMELEIDFSERLVDLVAEGFDAAIRAGPLASSSMIAH
ncbi:LysR substrate-binding domain-containing protein, partial [Streptomyces sp. URMC 126]|uniref:LysR substrate-binding domain-containing protein n=1 Tax=Streptomyces sp. URMC 126 TaxID=3423401 RepID=UPI003F1B4008